MITPALASRPTALLRRAGVLALAGTLVQHPFALAWAADPIGAGGGAKSAAGPALSAPASGIAVLARAGAEDAGWALAKEVYALTSLRPTSLDEANARVLVGDAAPSGASQSTRDLADERAIIRGEDGGSRGILKMIASQLDVRAIAVVEATASGSFSVRIFLADTGQFDAARYDPDAPPVLPVPTPATIVADAGAAPAQGAASDGGMTPVGTSNASNAPAAKPVVRWSGAVASLDRAYGANGNVGPETTPAPGLATSAPPPPAHKGSESHPFYASPWFWGAIGAAAFGGAALYFATRDNTTGTIHLELQVPK